MLDYHFVSSVDVHLLRLHFRPHLTPSSMSSVRNGTEQALRDESQVPQQMGAYITCLIIAYTGVALRFLCRRMKQTQLETDDWLILASLVSSDLTNEKYTMHLWLTLIWASSSQQRLRALT